MFVSLIRLWILATTFTFLFCQNTFSNDLFSAQRNEYKGFWTSCVYTNNGKLNIRVAQTEDNSGELYYKISDSGIFDGSPYADTSTITFNLIADEVGQRAKLEYWFPYPKIGFIPSIKKKRIVLEGIFKRLDRDSWHLIVKDENLEIELNVTASRMDGIYNYSGIKYPFIDRFEGDAGVFSIVKTELEVAAATIELKCP
ncbi:MAG: hypothetical protein K8S13_08530 [Desulfobacula sp.]|uniref:hypothetical protein n=1 Tax=Desulfobacula sp. TaxID=2593537 RepID=UPI0025C118D5|nr:hypothetical protein [Desulfobacula sp.]MCD4719892.1 hypothetical protein [Desulfobacula sp.]